MSDHKIVVTRDERDLARLAEFRPVTEQDRADHYTWRVVCSDRGRRYGRADGGPVCGVQPGRGAGGAGISRCGADRR